MICGPSNFEVIERPSNQSHGIYSSLDEARGCVEFDGLTDFEIWQGDHIVEDSDPNAAGNADWLADEHDAKVNREEREEGERLDALDDERELGLD